MLYQNSNFKCKRFLFKYPSPNPIALAAFEEKETYLFFFKKEKEN
jgi:hypothetical protein